MQQKQQEPQLLKKIKPFDLRVEGLRHIYTNVFNQETDKRVKRYEQILGRFQKIYGDEPQYFIRAPAIVDLFGDNGLEGLGYRKLSFPIEQDVVIAIKKNEKQKEIKIEHMQQVLYPQQKLETDYNKLQFKGQENQIQQVNNQNNTNNDNVEGNTDHFHNLFVAGYKAAVTGADATSLHGLNILVDFNFQQNSQIAFSNAYQIASAFATLSINNHIKPNFEILLHTLQKYKKSICSQSKETQGQGQLLGLIGQQSNIYTINQTSQQLDVSRFPPADKKPGNNMVFLFADSLTDKVRSQKQKIDKRICEVKIGIHLLFRGCEITKDREQYKTLKQLANFLNYTADDMQECVKQHVDDKEYSILELEALLETPLQEICIGSSYIEGAIKNNSSFNPRKRLLHYLQEEEIIENTAKLLKEQPKSVEESQKIWKQISDQMNQSYLNQKTLLQASSENIEKLRSLMLSLGCSGVKLLGYGDDGILAGLIPESKVDKTIEFITEEYYLKKDNKLSVTDDIEQYLYKSHPCVGAKILDPEFEIWFV